MTDEQKAIELNQRMVDELVREGPIHDPRVEDAFRTVLRHWFLPDTPLDEVYRDRAVVTHRGPDGVPVSSSSQPTVMARMLDQLGVEPGHRVLEIGAGTGYNAALLSQLVAADGEVVTVDVDPDVTADAKHHLRRAGVSNVSVVISDGWSQAGHGLYDRIEATVGVSDLSPPWVDQLRSGGILVVPLGLRAGLQACGAFQKLDGCLETLTVLGCGFMSLRGPSAGQVGHHQVGSWTVSFDGLHPDKRALLAGLLGDQPRSEPAPALSPAWFTPIALRETDAVHLFSFREDGPVVYTGILDLDAPGLAVVESHPVAHVAAETVHTFGDEQARTRLLALIDATAPVEVSELAITAVPADEQVDEPEALAVLARPNFSFVISRSTRRRP